MIRPFGLRDLLRLEQLDVPKTAFDARRVLLYAPSATNAAILGYLTCHRLGTVTYIQQNSDAEEVEGFVEAWPRGGRPEWDLAFLAPSFDEEGADSVWQRLLSALIVAAAEKKVSRIYARSPDDVWAERILRQTGFSFVKREEIFALTSETAFAPRIEGVCSVEAGDGSVPRALCRRARSHLEKNSQGVPLYGFVDFHPCPRLGTTVDDYVCVQKDTPFAYLRLQGSSRGYWLDVIVDPENRSCLGACMKYVLSLTECGEEMPLYCPVPHYTPWLGGLLRELGFSSYTKQVVVVAHTMARVPLRSEIAVSALKRGVDIGAPVGQMFRLPMQRTGK
ncbi:MAG: hypothetical protein U9R48_09310 [Chloroflexota bacterium]|nr:hypothetical protein [Chloroflexota bacterium]